MCCATNKSNVNTSKNQQESLSISPENSGETIDYVEFMVIMRVKCQCNKSSIMISVELHRSGLSASDDVLVFSSDYGYADCKIINKNHLW